MASSKEYLAFILGQFSGLTRPVTYRAMMGEYILYYGGRTLGGVYDDRLLVKPVPAAQAMMPEAREELPYTDAKPMLLVENVDDPAFLCRLLDAMYPELPQPKKR